MLFILLIIIGVAALLGFIIGLCKGVTNVKTWAMDLLLASAVSIPVSHIVDLGNVYLDTSVILGVTVLSLLVFMLISALVKKFLEDRWKPFDKICGGIVVAVKGATIVAIILSILLSLMELINISALNDMLSSVFESSLWTMIKPYIFDYLLIAFTLFLIKQGYKTGIMGVVWLVIRLVLYLGALYLAYWLSFNVSAFVSAAETLGEKLGFLSTMASYTEQLSSSLNAAFFGKCLMTIVLAIVLLIVARIFSFIISKLIDNLKEAPAFAVVDGTIGAIFMYAVFMAILLLLGAFLYSFVELEFMNGFSEYFTGGIASVFYDENTFSNLSFIANLNLASYLQ